LGAIAAVIEYGADVRARMMHLVTLSAVGGGRVVVEVKGVVNEEIRSERTEQT
jgi:microcompartment protein CcmL/EutN